MKNLRGKNAILTGGSRGMGPVIGRALAREGVNLVLVARTEGLLKEVAADLARVGVRTLAKPADLTDPEARRRLVAEATAELGPIDLLVNNAGVDQVGLFTDFSEADIARMVENNVTTPLMLTRLVLPGMLQRRRGHIVTLAALAGKKGGAYISTYSATKAALIEWNSALREELAGTGVGASVICPSFVSDVGMFAGYKEHAPPTCAGRVVGAGGGGRRPGHQRESRRSPGHGGSNSARAAAQYALSRSRHCHSHPPGRRRALAAHCRA
jgi:short-subunit dehydrogenase